LRELTSAHAAEYPIVVLVQHNFSFSWRALFLQHGPIKTWSSHNRTAKTSADLVREEVSAGRNQNVELGIKSRVRIAYRASQSVAGMREPSCASRDLLDFVFCELASTHPAQYPVLVVVRHRLSPFELRFSNIVDEIKTHKTEI
jgi:hypothetical protein